MSNRNEPPKVVILGAGFAGIELIKQLRFSPVEITLIDKHNYHQFTPLLYQVATSQLEIEEIVFPIRQIVHKHENIKFLMAEVDNIDEENKIVLTNRGIVNYDYLIVGTGTTTNYFEVVNARKFSYPLKELLDGVRLRNHILTLIETRTALCENPTSLRPLSFVIIGGGPTGVEFAGALAELIHGPILKDHPGLSIDDFKISLVDSGSRLLRQFDEKLSSYTERKLNKLGVDIYKNHYVTELTANDVYLKDGTVIQSDTTIWSAGIKGSEFLSKTTLPIDKNRFVLVDQFLRVIGREDVYAIGDIANIDKCPLPKMATVAQQQGKYVGKLIKNKITGKENSPFKFKDKGKMAVIGRNAAVVELNRLKFSGFFAWLSWSLLHIYKLIGFRNRLNIMINWAIAYFRKGGQSRVILPLKQSPSKEKLIVN